VPYWLAAGRLTSAPVRHPTSRVLTAEQFDALPEIVYSGKVESGSDDEDEYMEEEYDVEAPGAVGIDSDDDADNMKRDAVVALSKEECAPNRERARKDDSTACSSPNDEGAVPVDRTDNNAHEDGANDEMSVNFTTCTTCSICIDDFERGERLTLLPKCRHAFHPDCLKPWLMERQGCCPLCKISVLDEPDDSTDDGEDGMSTGRSPGYGDLSSISPRSFADDATDMAQGGSVAVEEEGEDRRPMSVIEALGHERVDSCPAIVEEADHERDIVVSPVARATAISASVARPVSFAVMDTAGIDARRMAVGDVYAVKDAYGARKSGPRSPGMLIVDCDEDIDVAPMHPVATALCEEEDNEIVLPHGCIQRAAFPSVHLQMEQGRDGATRGNVVSDDDGDGGDDNDTDGSCYLDDVDMSNLAADHDADNASVVDDSSHDKQSPIYVDDDDVLDENVADKNDVDDSLYVPKLPDRSMGEVHD
jgi:Ring finger domain